MLRQCLHKTSKIGIFLLASSELSKDPIIIDDKTDPEITCQYSKETSLSWRRPLLNRKPVLSFCLDRNLSSVIAY